MSFHQVKREVDKTKEQREKKVQWYIEWMEKLVNEHEVANSVTPFLQNKIKDKIKLETDKGRKTVIIYVYFGLGIAGEAEKELREFQDADSKRFDREFRFFFRHFYQKALADSARTIRETDVNLQEENLKKALEHHQNYERMERKAYDYCNKAFVEPLKEAGFGISSHPWIKSDFQLCYKLEW